MNPIMKGLNQGQPQQQPPEPLEGIESLVAPPTQPQQPSPEPLEGIESLSPATPQPTSMADWMKNYEFDLAPSRPEWQPGQNIQDIMQAHTNSPEYQAWQQREEERGPLSQSTLDAIRGGQSFSSNPGNSIDAYIRGGGGSYEDYLGAHEKAKKMNQIRNDWVAGGGKDQMELMNLLNQSGLATGSLGIGGLTGQQQQLRQQIQYDPTKMMGGENWTPLGQEEYKRQSDLWGRHMDYTNFSKAAFDQLGTAGNDIRRYRMGANPMFGHAYEAWNQFNQSQAGGPYTNPNAPTGLPSLMNNTFPYEYKQGPQQQQLQQPLQQGLGAGLGSLQGPTQQKIQQGYQV